MIGPLDLERLKSKALVPSVGQNEHCHPLTLLTLLFLCGCFRSPLALAQVGMPTPIQAHCTTLRGTRRIPEVSIIQHMRSGRLVHGSEAEAVSRDWKREAGTRHTETGPRLF